MTWQHSRLTRQRRCKALGYTGATVWFTGLPAAGKTTVAVALEETLVSTGKPAVLLDGDNLRHGLNSDLGFSEEERKENVRRTAHVASLMADCGVIALVSLVSPYACDREAAATLHADAHLCFIEVYVDTPLKLCEERDPKRLYNRSREGDITGLTGIDAPYEPPSAPDVILHHRNRVDVSVEQVMLLLVTRL